MAIGLLGGLLLGGGVLGANKILQDNEQARQQQQFRTMLDPIMQDLSQNPFDPMARTQFINLHQNAGYRSDQINQRLAPFDRVDAYQNQAERNTQLSRISGEYNKAVDQYRAPIEKYVNSIKLVNERGGVEKMQGADDMTLIRNFIKMTVPNEAVMSDDQRAAQMAAMGFGTLEQLKNIISGKGTFDAQGRANILQTMNTIAKNSYDGYQETRDLYSNMATNQFLQPGEFMRPEMSVPQFNWQPRVPQPAPPVDTPLPNQDEEAEYQMLLEKRRSEMRGMIQR